jgi:hypothetical protein
MRPKLRQALRGGDAAAAEALLARGSQQPREAEPLSADLNPNALKDTYDHSCFLAR